VGMGWLKDLQKESVLEMLAEGIEWRIRTGDNQAVPVESLPQFKVAVSSIQVVPPQDEKSFPQYVGNWEVHTAVTDGKPGGLTFDDPI